MSTPANRELFVKQLENILDGIKQNLSKVNKELSFLKILNQKSNLI
jgi:hypothetical protein